MVTNGVIEKETGDLLRAGFCDFENDGEFKPDTEEIRNDVPFPVAIVSNGDLDYFQRYINEEWVIIQK